MHSPTISPGALAARAGSLAARVTGSRTASRALPIRSSADEVDRLWRARRGDILDGISAKTATLTRGAEQGEWGTTWTVRVELDPPLPGRLAQTMSGKVVRRLKALAETGEMPTTEHNPAYRGGGKGGQG